MLGLVPPEFEVARIIANAGVGSPLNPSDEAARQLSALLDELTTTDLPNHVELAPAV